MESLPLVLIAIVAPMGAIDVFYFHIYKFRLHARAESWTETLTHVFRGVFLGLFTLLITAATPHGAWFWVGAALIAADVLNNLADIIVEPKARAAFGGLPPAEYVMHMIGGSVSGAVALGYLLIFGPYAGLPTELAAPAHPVWLMINGYVIAFSAFAIAAVETSLMARSILRRTRVGTRVAA